MWGSNARNAHPIFFHHVLKAVNNGAKLFVVDPRRSETAQFADRWLGLHVGSDIALSNTIAREIIHAGLAHDGLHRPRHERLRGLHGVGRGLDARTRRAGHGRAGRDDSRAGPHVRHGQGRPAVLDARHHRAPQRRRQRARAVQPGAADRPGRPLRRRPQPAARAEQRAGRRRHGRAAQQAARLPGRRRRRRPQEVRDALGRRRSRPSTAGTSPRCSRRWSAATCGRCS